MWLIPTKVAFACSARVFTAINDRWVCNSSRSSTLVATTGERGRPANQLDQTNA